VPGEHGLIAELLLPPVSSWMVEHHLARDAGYRDRVAEVSV
jgi:predicted metallo-beta-lactamase superfamily hydrolase